MGYTTTLAERSADYLRKEAIATEALIVTAPGVRDEMIQRRNDLREEILQRLNVMRDEILETREYLKAAEEAEEPWDDEIRELKRLLDQQKNLRQILIDALGEMGP